MSKDHPGSEASRRDDASDLYLRHAETGQASLLEQLLADHSQRAYTQARRMLRYPADADDAVQEAFLQLVRTARRYDGSVPFSAWLGRLVHIACLRALRSRGRHRRQRAIVTAPAEPLVAEDPDAISETIHSAVARLPERYRAPIALHYFGQLDLPQTAAALGVSVATVSVRLHRARERLRARLVTRGQPIAGAELTSLLASAPVHYVPVAVTSANAHLVAAAASGAPVPATTISLGTIQQGALFMTTHPIACLLIAVLALAGACLPVALRAAEVVHMPEIQSPSASTIATLTVADFARLQRDDGSWNDSTSLHGFTGWQTAEPIGSSDHTTVCTGLVTLVYLGAGYDHRTPSAQRAVVARAIAWMVSAQAADGSFPDGTIAQAIATMALSEARAMSGDHALDDPVARAVAALLAMRVHPARHSSWLVWQDGAGAMSARINALCVMALKSASVGGSHASAPALVEARTWFQEAWTSANPRRLDPDRDTSRFPSRLEDADAGDDPVSALVIDLFTTPTDGSMLRRTLANAVLARPWPTSLDTTDAWLRTLTVYQNNGKAKAWGAAARARVYGAVTQTGPFAGSWAAGSSEPALGRVSSSACAVLMQYVFDRVDAQSDPTKNIIIVVSPVEADPPEVQPASEWK